MVQAEARHGNGSIGVHVEGPNEQSPEDAVVLNTLTYAYSGHRPIVSDISLSLPKGSRCLLLGANGAGEHGLSGRVMLCLQMLKYVGLLRFLLSPAYTLTTFLKYKVELWS